MSKTKADLERENAAQRDIIAALGKEKDALRDVLAAVHAAAGAVPISAAGQDYKEHRRARHILIALKVICDPGGTWAWGWECGAAAKRIREVAAEPLDYAVYEPEPEAAVCAEGARPRPRHLLHDEDHGKGDGDPALCQFHGGSRDEECVQCARDEADTLAAHEREETIRALAEAAAEARSAVPAYGRCDAEVLHPETGDSLACYRREASHDGGWHYDLDREAAWQQDGGMVTIVRTEAEASRT